MAKTITTNEFTTEPSNYHGIIKSQTYKPWRYELDDRFLQSSWLFEKPLAYPGNTVDTNIKRVVFDPPCTIVYWGDGSKTVVRCAEGDIFNESAGVALCFMKHLYKDDYKPTLKNAIKNAERPFRKAKKVLKQNLKSDDNHAPAFRDTFNRMATAFNNFFDKYEKEIKKHVDNNNN